MKRSNEFLLELVSQIQEEGAENWANRIHEQFGIELVDLDEVARKELPGMKSHAQELGTNQTLRLAMTGGIFIGLAVAMSIGDSKENLDTELKELLGGKEDK